jgi:hypothetical protein
MKGLILLRSKKTSLTQWDNLGETLSAYYISLTSLCKNPMKKSRNRQILVYTFPREKPFNGKFL